MISNNVVFSRFSRSFFLCDNFDRNEVVVIKTCVNNCAILCCNECINSIKSCKTCCTFYADCVRSVLSVCIRINNNLCTSLNHEGDGTGDLNFATVVSYATVDSNSGVILNCSKSIGSGEVENCVFCDCGICVSAFVSNHNGNSLTTEAEYYGICACNVLVNCACVNCVIRNCNNRAVRVVSLNNSVCKSKLVSNC